MTAAVVQPDEFPHGLQCIDCGVVLLVGDVYVSRPVGDAVFELVCQLCGEGVGVAS